VQVAHDRAEVLAFEEVDLARVRARDRGGGRARDKG